MKATAFLALLPLACPTSGSLFHVSADAAPGGDGSEQRPFRTPHAAVAAARRAPGPHVIEVGSGTYAFERPLALGGKDNGLTIRTARDGAAIFSGGVRITGWTPEPGTPFWSADVPGAAGDGWYFRALSVDGRPAKRAEYPGGTNKLEHLRKWTVRWMSSVGNGWERPPTDEEMRTMPYRRDDLPPGMDWASADVRTYHSWNDSLVRTASNDASRAVLFFRTPTIKPAGSFGNRRYVVYNVREGMTEPGQWYLDATAGRLHYWPRPGEDMERVCVMAPRLETLLTVCDADGVTLRGIAFECTASPNRTADFGGTGLPGAIACRSIRRCRFERLSVRATGAIGLSLRKGTDCRIEGCDFRDTGSCAIVASGSRTVIASNRIARAGRVFTSACGAWVWGADVRFAGNALEDIPYCGVCFGGKRHVYEGNRVRRVMRLLHDGAAFYGGGASSGCTIRGNDVADIVPNGKGTGCFAFYFDEGAHDDTVESNRTDGVSVPVHIHMARGISVRGNAFRSSGGVKVSFHRCLGCSFEENVIVTDGAVNIPQPEAFAAWRGNRRLACGDEDGAGREIPLPPVRRLKPRTDSLPAPRIDVAPPFDGTFDPKAWPGVWSDIDRAEGRRPMQCAPVWVRAAHDPTNLYLAVRMAMFLHERQNGKSAANAVAFDFGTCRVSGRADGESNARRYFGGHEKESARGLGRMDLFLFAVPLADIGFASPPPAGTELAFNCSVVNAVYGETRYWESPSPTNALPGRLVFAGPRP